MFEKLNRYKDIVWYRNLADLKSESNRTYLGFAWFLLEPILQTMILYFVFGLLMGDNRNSDFIPFLLVGMIIWQWNEGAISVGMTGIARKAHIMNMVSLPKHLFPFVNIVNNTIKFLFVFLVVSFLANILGFYVNYNYCYLPILIIANLIFICGISLPLAILSAYIPDTEVVVRAGFRLLFFVSGIFFTPERVPEYLLQYFYINPIACMMTAFRSIIVYNRHPNWGDIAYTVLFGGTILLLSLMVCKKIDKKILKYIHV